MDNSHQVIDLDLWMDLSLIQRQNHLKNQFQQILERVSDFLPSEDLVKIHGRSKGKKISKGNELVGSPYLVLDLFRDFDPLLGLNFRILCWMGRGCFLMILGGKEVKLPTENLLSQGFAFGLAQEKWDFEKLILENSTARSMDVIQASQQEFSLWIKEVSLKNSIDLNSTLLTTEVKKILDYLDQRKK